MGNGAMAKGPQATAPILELYQLRHPVLVSYLTLS